ncbi:MAG TPA: hypothetical protein PKK57_07400 [Verrucomicrobiota bacterium]|nr:hypothetical protein [Verrucomicrobiota bacterium]HOU86368.1 hypothetical protein [Verrucomicrobiota bacterium]HPV09486.1 hypothetical protein [Verrucomicrobiota bacterium]HQI31759.1 hypothetical protein [Verrucomicrobiota bacterium]
MTRNGPTDGFGRRLSPPSHSSHEGFIPPHGGCERLFACTKSQIICDATVRFCDRFISPESRTHDQMVQAARSGNKNSAEGSRISGIVICLIHQANCLLDQQLRRLDHDFLEQGGPRASDSVVTRVQCAAHSARARRNHPRRCTWSITHGTRCCGPGIQSAFMGGFMAAASLASRLWRRMCR